jgi:arsenate reductase
MAEAILRQVAGDRFDAFSAGMRVGMTVEPQTLAVLEEAGYDTTGLHSKSIEEYFGSLHPDFLITVCDVAERECMHYFPMGVYHLSWPVPDPTVVVGDEDARLDAFRAARDDVRARIDSWLENVGSGAQ